MLRSIMPNLRASCGTTVAVVLLFLCLSILCATPAVAQIHKPQSTPIGPANCDALKQQYNDAIKAGNGALVNQLGQELVKQGCYDPPKTPPAPPTLGYSVGKTQTVSFNGAGPSEGQSTVIPPGKNAACPAGRLLISNDWVRPPGAIVTGRDLSGSVADTISTFDAPPHPEYYAYGTNDHDLVSLSDGTALYLTGAFSREPLKTQPAWWNVAYRGAFGPGARSNLMVWRSTDCGASFHYFSEMDPALMEDGSCANPQGSLDSAHHYDMGGSDGQLVKLDPANNHLYLTFSCVGQEGSTNANGVFVLSSTALNKTLVAESTDLGKSWQSMGFVNGVRWWRFGTVPLADRVAFGFANNLFFGTPSGGKLAFGKAQPLSGQFGGFNWTTSPFNPDPSPDPYLFSNVWGTTLIARAGEGQGLLLAFPTITGSGANATNGYSVFFHDLAGGGYSEMPAIVPLTHSPANYTMEVTAIDLGTGPVLLYWTDVNTTSHKARIRGRIIVSVGQYSSDFDISGDADLTAAANSYFPNPPLAFYGDYHTASGYAQHSQSRVMLGTSAVYHFYPLWVDRTGGARYAMVTVSIGSGLPNGSQLQVSSIAANQWRAQQASVELQNFKGKLPRVRETIRGSVRPAERDRR